MYAYAKLQLDQEGRTPGSDGAGWLNAWLGDIGDFDSVPAGCTLSFHVGAEARDGSHQLFGGCATTTDEYLKSWETGGAIGTEQGAQWPQLRDTASRGAALTFTAVVVEGAAPLGAGVELRVASAAGSLSAQHLFGGSFSDVDIVCGGRRFAAHRAVLAMASPVFHSMLDSEMVEGRGAPEVEIREADPAALELLLRHAYGAAVDVPLALAPQLCGLADRFQLRTDLAEQLQLWLSTVDVQPAVLCELLPAAHTLCPYACSTSLFSRAIEAITDIITLDAFGSWPVELVIEVMGDANSAARAFDAAAAWMAAQPRPAKRAVKCTAGRRCWAP